MFLASEKLSEFQESFVYGSTEFLFTNYKVTWAEAKYICETVGEKRQNQSHLVVLDSNNKTEFLAEALATSEIDLKLLWIGAKRKENTTKYYWVNNVGFYVPDRYFVKRGNESIDVEKYRNCLSITRFEHDYPLLVNLECRLRRPFICQTRK